MTPDNRTHVCDVPVFYATSEGQTQRIAERIATVVSQAGLVSRAIDLRAADAGGVDWTAVRAVVVGASLHEGRHQRRAGRFVSAHAADLNAHPSAFFSVSLSAASHRQAEVRAARAIAEAFPAAHGWTPGIVATIAGRLAYTQYGWLKRWLMKRIARKEGGPIDTTRDHELTDWNAVDEFAWQIAASTAARAA